MEQIFGYIAFFSLVLSLILAFGEADYKKTNNPNLTIDLLLLGGAGFFGLIGVIFFFLVLIAPILKILKEIIF